jgi:DNA-binding NarL/FixJ family response regulator
MKLLIADDSEILRSRLIEMLSHIPGIEIVGEVENGVDAVVFADRLKPDVIILDIRMPTADGILALESIRRSNTISKIIILTNYPYPQYKQKCLEAGADYFFSKSEEIEKMIGTLQDINQEFIQV